MEVPVWLQEQIMSVCPYCGAPITNNEQLTDRYCSNPNCPEHMAHKMNLLAKRFGIKGFGVATARSFIRLKNFRSHLDILRVWFPDRPELELHELGEICFIKGHQKKWRDYCEGYSTMLELIRSGTLPSDIYPYRTLLLQASCLCKTKPRLTGSRINVMMSGSFSGYSSRSEYLREMNQQFGQVVQLVDVGKRKTDVDFLVKESYTSDHEKSVIARQSGIPVITPQGLKEKIETLYTYINERRSLE